MEAPAVSNCALASSKVDTRSERVIGQVTVNDQNQRSGRDRHGSHRSGQQPIRR